MARYIIDNQQDEIDFEIRNETDRVIRNCKNLLMTQMGEVPYDRLRGFDPALYHLPMGQFRTALMPELDRVLQWEPRAEAVSAETEMIGHEVLIRLEIEIDESLV